LIVRLSADKAHMTSFFTCHSGRAALGVSTWSAQEIGSRRAGPSEQALPFAGFDREQSEERESKLARGKRELSAEPAADGGTAEDQPPALTVRTDQLFALWLPDPDPFSRLLARSPAALLPQSMHPMLALGSALVAAPDNAKLARRHVLAAAAELPLLGSELSQLFPPGARAALADLSQVSRRNKRVLSDDGAIVLDQEIAFDAELPGGSTAAVSDQVGSIQSRADGETVLETDRVRLGCVAYPGRVLVRGGRRYRVLLPEEQARTEEGVMLAEPERRRVRTARLRQLALSFEGKGHQLRLGGGVSLRFHRPRVHLRETVTGLRLAREGRRAEDLIAYETPIVGEYTTEAALVHLPSAPPEALHGLEHLVRVTLPGFLRHDEDDVDVAVLDDARLAIVDRHPGGVGFARAVTSDLLRHLLYWSREIARACGKSADCTAADGCDQCVHGAPCLSPPERARPGRTATLALLDELLGRE
jgi:ATP-dependent helicase YprA (DUF1998 family)